MKKLVAIALIATALLSSAAPTSALVVSDPGGYARMAQQLEEAKRMANTINQQLREIERTRAALEGNYRRGVGVVRGVQKMSDATRNLSAGFFKISMPGVNISNPGDIKQLKSYYDKLFPPASSSVDAAPAEMTAPLREAYQQRSIKSALESSEFYISNIQNTWDEMRDLMEEIDRTENLKDATDLGNRFLAELIRQQIQTNLLLAQLTRAETALTYQGASEEEPEMKTERAEQVMYSGFGKKHESGVVPMSPEHRKGVEDGAAFFDAANK